MQISQHLSQAFAALGDPTRLAILNRLAAESEGWTNITPYPVPGGYVGDPPQRNDGAIVMGEVPLLDYTRSPNAVARLGAGDDILYANAHIRLVEEPPVREYEVNVRTAAVLARVVYRDANCHALAFVCCIAAAWGWEV